MFTKSSIALAIIVALSSGAFAATKRHDGPATSAQAFSIYSQLGPITLPAKTPEENRRGWFMDE